MSKPYLTRKESIILCAIDIIDELGMNELSTREIARRQAVSDASLYRHFKSKQDIILGVLEYYCNFDSMIINTIENKNLTPKESILFFFNSFAEYYENYPAISALVIANDSLQHDEVIAEKFNTIVRTRCSYICTMATRGQIQGTINSHLNAEELTDILTGTFLRLTLKWRLKKFEISLKSMVNSTISGLISLL